MFLSEANWITSGGFPQTRREITRIANVNLIFFFGCGGGGAGGVIILPAFASQLAHKLILNSRFGIPQLGVFVRNNLTRTPFVHRL